MSVDFTDNTGAVLEAFRAAIEKGLEDVGRAAEKYAVLKTPTKTGNLKGSITHAVRDTTAYVGTNSEYGAYVELGTGRYASNGKGRPGWWVYVVDSDGGGKRHVNAEKKIYTEAEARQIMAILRSKGLDAHMTQGIKPHHMIRDAAADHTEQYMRMIERALKGV